MARAGGAGGRVAPAGLVRRPRRPEHEGADFTLQASAQVLFAGLVGAMSGVLAKSVGYVPLFTMAGTLGLAALTLLRFGIVRLEAADART